MRPEMPVLETERLVIRPFTMDDLETVHLVLSEAWREPAEERESRLLAREAWLRWTVESYEGLAGVFQPPYGDRAIIRKTDVELIGSVGLVPSLGPFGQLPDFPANKGSRFMFPEVGLFWAVSPGSQRLGYATEAGRAVADFALHQLNVGRVVATTEYNNAASIAVMRKLDMRILRNPEPEPPWFQVVGLLEQA